MKKYFLFVIATIFCAFSYAQEIKNSSTLLKELEKPDSATGAKVVAINHVPIDLIGKEQFVDGYRIRIFFDNSQQARTECDEEQKRYLELYPNDNTYIDYQAPYFKLTVGDFVNHEEAQIKWHKVVVDFKTAFIVKEKIDINLFKHQPKIDSLLLPKLDSLENIKKLE